MKRWNINYLKQLHAKYNSLAVNTDDHTISLEYERAANSVLNVIERYDELVHRKSIYTEALEVNNYRSIINSDFKIISEYGYYCPYIRLLSDYNDIVDINPNVELPVIASGAERIISVSSNFYNKFKGIFLDTYKQIASNFNNTLHLRKITGSTITAGQTYSIYNTGIAFFELGYNNTLQDYVSAIHEFGHGISCNLNPNAMWDFGKYCFIEVDALLFELIGTDFLGDNLDRKKDAFDINLHVLKDYMYVALLISTKLDIYSMCDRNNLNNRRFFKKFLSNEICLSKTGVNDVMSTYIKDYMHYIVSYLTAIELYLIYQEDTDKALALLFKIIKAQKENNKQYLDYVKGLGIEPGKNFDKYINLLFEKAKDVNDEKSLRYKN